MIVAGRPLDSLGICRPRWKRMTPRKGPRWRGICFRGARNETVADLTSGHSSRRRFKRRHPGAILRYLDAVGLEDQHPPVLAVIGGDIGLLRHDVVEAGHRFELGRDRLVPDLSPIRRRISVSWGSRSAHRGPPGRRSASRRSVGRHRKRGRRILSWAFVSPSAGQGRRTRPAPACRDNSQSRTACRWPR